jgi:hypothetical protein
METKKVFRLLSDSSKNQIRPIKWQRILKTIHLILNLEGLAQTKLLKQMETLSHKPSQR